MPIYHVAKSWDGNDLRSLAQQCDDGDISLDDALEMIASKWSDARPEEYLDTDGHQVHCHATIEDAINFRDEFCEGGEILEIDTAELRVEVGSEYPHPVVANVVPAECVKVAITA